MQPSFHFSITAALRESWQLLLRHRAFFIVLSLVMIILSFGSDNKHIHPALSILVGIVSFVASIAWIKVSLAAARGHEDKFSLARAYDFVPSVSELLHLIGVYLISILFIFAGFVALIIPGIYIALRLSGAALAYLDRREGVRASVRFSWAITKGVFWTVALTGLTALALYIVGAITFGIGLIITYPLATLLTAKLYVALADHHAQAQTVAVQPAEIAQAPEPEIPSTETPTA